MSYKTGGENPIFGTLPLIIRGLFAGAMNLRKT